MGRANPVGRPFQWSGGDVIVVWVWVEAEEMERKRGWETERTALLTVWVGALRQRQLLRMVSREAGRRMVGQWGCW